MQHEFLNARFVEAMNEIGRHGHEKYGQLPRSRASHPSPARVTPVEIANHADGHFRMYLAGTPHDHFGTRRHQLAAVAYNAMMEFHFAGLDAEEG